MSAFLGLAALGAGWIGCFWCCRELAVRGAFCRDARFSMGLATCAWGALLTAVVEGLSLGHSLNQPGLVAGWVAADTALWLVAAGLARSRGALSGRQFLEACGRARSRCNALPPFAKACWLGVVLIAAFLLGVAVTTPTTNWDSLSYHLPRVLHWLQQHSVEHFPTENTRQIEFGPWAGFVQAHLFLLGGNDRLAAVPQWLAMVLTVLLSSLLVEQLGRVCGLAGLNGDDSAARAKRQSASALAALVAATIPMGMMQSLTPQTDYLTACWLACFFVFALALWVEPDHPWNWLGAALAAGLGALTKATTYVYAAPLVVAGAVWWLSRPRPLRWKLARAVLFGGVFLALNGPHLFRNYALFGSPFGSQEIHRLECNERFTLGVFASNLTRNLALHNNCGLPSVTRALNRFALAVHARTGERLDDPGTTYPPGPVTFHEPFILYDDYASAPLHVLWIALALALALGRARPHARLLVYAGLVLLSAGLFAALLKFQIWHSRFHLAYLILFSPFVALVMMQSAPRWVRAAVAGSLFAFAVVCLRCNEARPIFHPRFAGLPREQQYLDLHGADWNEPTRRIAEDIVAAGCANVGLKLGFDAFEYPLWLMLGNRGFAGRLDHFSVEHVSARIPSSAPPPDVIIARQSVPPEAVRLRYPFRTDYPPLMLLWAEKPPALSHDERGQVR